MIVIGSFRKLIPIIVEITAFDFYDAHVLRVPFNVRCIEPISWNEKLRVVVVPFRMVPVFLYSPHNPPSWLVETLIYIVPMLQCENTLQKKYCIVNNGLLPDLQYLTSTRTKKTSNCMEAK